MVHYSWRLVSTFTALHAVLIRERLHKKKGDTPKFSKRVSSENASASLLFQIEIDKTYTQLLAIQLVIRWYSDPQKGNRGITEEE